MELYFPHTFNHCSIISLLVYESVRYMKCVPTLQWLRNKQFLSIHLWCYRSVLLFLTSHGHKHENKKLQMTTEILDVAYIWKLEPSITGLFNKGLPNHSLTSAVRSNSKLRPFARNKHKCFSFFTDFTTAGQLLCYLYQNEL